MSTFGSAPALYVAEPPAIYLARPPIVVDASAICAVLFDEPERAEAVASLCGKTPYAPCLLDHEIASVALKKRRRGWPTESLDLALADYSEWKIELRPCDFMGQYELAVRYGLTSYDAAYLWLAAELRAPLATFDAQLAKAAREHLASLS